VAEKTQEEKVQEARKKLEELLRRKRQVEFDKKTAVKSYDDELKDIKDELKITLDDLDKLQVK